MKISFPILFLLGLALAISEAKGQYYDSTTDTEAASYLSSVEQAGGFKNMPNFSRIDAFMLAKTLGNMDRNALEPAAFAEHLEESEEVRNRFYPRMDAINFRTYLLPFRIREENCLDSGWRKAIRDQVEPLIQGLTTPEDAAPKILAWCQARVRNLDGDNCYPLGLKDDLDPLTTLRASSASEVDLSILAVAALRSAGVAARLVTAPVISGRAGGKVWVEYRANDKWIPWIASCPGGMDSRAYLAKQFGGCLTLVLANPDVPINITSRYAPVAHVTVTFNNCDGQDRPGWNLLVQGSDQLRPVTGRNIYLCLSDSVDVAPGNYILVAGDRNHISALKPFTVSAGQTASYVLDFGTQGGQSMQIEDASQAANPDVQINPPFNEDANVNPNLW